MNPNYQHHRPKQSASSSPSQSQQQQQQQQSASNSNSNSSNNSRSVNKKSFLEIQQEALLLQQRQQQQAQRKQQEEQRTQTHVDNTMSTTLSSSTTTNITNTNNKNTTRRVNQSNNNNNNTSSSNNNNSSSSSKSTTKGKSSSSTTSMPTTTGSNYRNSKSNSKNNKDKDNNNQYYYGIIASLKKDFGFISYYERTTSTSNDSCTNHDNNTIDNNDTTTTTTTTPSSSSSPIEKQIFFHCSAMITTDVSSSSQDNDVVIHSEFYTNKSFDTLEIYDEVEFCIKIKNNNNNNNQTNDSNTTNATTTSNTTNNKSYMAIQIRTLQIGTIQYINDIHQMKYAKLEYGIIYQLYNHYGMIQSNYRNRNNMLIYFQYDHIDIIEDDSNDNDNNEDRAEENVGDDKEGNDQNNTKTSINNKNQQQLVLEVGQDVQFYVIQELDTSGIYSNNNNNNNNTNNTRKKSNPTYRLCARKIQLLPKGTVSFYNIIIKGQTGIVTKLPQNISTSNDNSNTNHSNKSKQSTTTVASMPTLSLLSLDTYGILYLQTPISVKNKRENNNIISDNSNENNETFITEVYVSMDDILTTCSNGKQQQQNQNNSISSYIRKGDTLLFDIVQYLCDDTYHAKPTLYNKPNNNTSNANDPDLLIQPLNAATISETNTLTINTEAVTDPKIRLIQLSLAGRSEGIISSIKDTYGFIQYIERNIDVHFKLQQVLPNNIQNTLRQNMNLSNHKNNNSDTITNQLLQLEVGAQVQFDLSIHGPSTSQNSSNNNNSSSPQHQQQRENMKAQRILFLPPNTFATFITIGTNIQGSIHQQDTMKPYCGIIKFDLDMITTLLSLSIPKRHPLMVQMIENYLKESSSLSSSFPPIEYNDIQSMKEVNVIIKVIETIGQGKLTYSYIPHGNDSNYPGRLVIQRKLDSDTNDILVDNNIDEKGSLGANDTPVLLEKNDSTTKTNSKYIRYDTKSYENEVMLNDIPPNIDDIIECDIVQCRRTGVFKIENMKIKQRCPIATYDIISATNINGTIQDIMTDFGFISIIDDTKNNKTKSKQNRSNTNEVIMFMINDPSQSLTNQNNSAYRKGDLVRFDIHTSTNGKRIAVNVVVQSKKLTNNNKGNSENTTNVCMGVVLLEPSHTTLKNTPLRKASSNTSQSTEKTSRWEAVDRNNNSTDDVAVAISDLGCIVMTSDPSGIFRSSSSAALTQNLSETNKDESITGQDNLPATDTRTGDEAARIEQHLRYKVSSLSIYQPGAMMTDVATSLTPRRGDLVSFVKVKNNSSNSGTSSTSPSTNNVIIRDIRLVTRGAASLIRGRLHFNKTTSENVELDTSDATNNETLGQFICDDESGLEYDIRVSDIVSCDPSLIKDQEEVEGVLYEGKIYGIARRTDLYLESKYAASTTGGTNNKERPKLNLTVKKGLGGKIVAQSMMAKGPDGTKGFLPGWTTRTSRFERKSELKVDAAEFIPIMRDTSVMIDDEQQEENII